MVLKVPMRIFIYVSIVKIDLAILYPRKSIADLRFAGAQRFDFGPVQNDARLEGLKDVILVASFGVGQDIGHRRRFETLNPNSKLIPKKRFRNLAFEIRHLLPNAACASWTS